MGQPQGRLAALNCGHVCERDEHGEHLAQFRANVADGRRNDSSSRFESFGNWHSQRSLLGMFDSSFAMSATAFPPCGVSSGPRASALARLPSAIWRLVVTARVWPPLRGVGRLVFQRGVLLSGTCSASGCRVFFCLFEFGPCILSCLWQSVLGSWRPGGMLPLFSPHPPRQRESALRLFPLLWQYGARQAAARWHWHLPTVCIKSLCVFCSHDRPCDFLPLALF